MDKAFVWERHVAVSRFELPSKRATFVNETQRKPLLIVYIELAQEPT